METHVMPLSCSYVQSMAIPACKVFRGQFQFTITLSGIGICIKEPCAHTEGSSRLYCAVSENITPCSVLKKT